MHELQHEIQRGRVKRPTLQRSRHRLHRVGNNALNVRLWVSRQYPLLGYIQGVLAQIHKRHVLFAQGSSLGFFDSGESCGGKEPIASSDLQMALGEVLAE